MLCLNKKISSREKVIAKFKSHCRRGRRMVSGGPVSSFQTLVSDVKKIITYPLSLHHKGYEEVERFMKERIDENGTLYSYATASFYMIYALLALGHSIQSPIIQKL